MKNILIISQYTVRESFARKIIIAFSAVSAVGILLTAIVFSFADTAAIYDEVGREMAATFQNEIVAYLMMIIITPLSGLGLLLAIFATSNLLPNILEKGTIDLFLSKPVSRTELLTGRFLGAVFVVFINIVFLVVGIWLVISLTFNVWFYEFLYASFTITFAYAALNAVIVLFGVITRSQVLGMMAAYFIFLILSPVLAARNDLAEIIGTGFGAGLLDFLYHITPKTSEIFGTVTSRLISGKAPHSWAPVTSTLIFIVVVTGISIYLFNKKDY